MKTRTVRMAAVTVCLFIVLVIVSASFLPVLQSRLSANRETVSDPRALEMADSDGDGLPDLEENYVHGTDWQNPDTDGDGMPDGWEVANRVDSPIDTLPTLDPTDPKDASGDADLDGLSNADEYALGTDPNDPDSDEDLMSDGWEWANGLDPTDPDDARDDLDTDGLSNLEEYLLGTNPWSMDTDGDGLNDQAEVKVHGTNPLHPDTDGDGMPDGWEVGFALKPTVAADAGEDDDGDGLVNLEEYVAGTSPRVMDTDGDGMPDGFEVGQGLAPTMWFDGGGARPSLAELVREAAGWPPGGFVPPLTLNATTDVDTDGLSNLEEFAIGTDPRSADTDGDNLTDMDEAVTYRHLGPLPGDPDTDDDGLWDDIEVLITHTNVTMPDTDSDGLGDYAEVMLRNTNPLDPDTDDDGLTDGWEAKPRRLDSTGLQHFQAPTDPLRNDTDGDGMPDGWEVQKGMWDGTEWTLDPTLYDADGDPDQDGLDNLEEYHLGTEPSNPDTDMDGMADGWEAIYGLNPLNPSDGGGDIDGDGLTNWEEYALGTSPVDTDTDKDGIPDGDDPYPIGIRPGAGWPYPWPFPEFRNESTLFNVEGPTARWWRLATFDAYDGYWWKPSALTTEALLSDIRSEVKTSFQSRESDYTLTHVTNYSLVASSQFFGYLKPDYGLLPSLLHARWVDGEEIYHAEYDLFGPPQTVTEYAAYEYRYSPNQLVTAPAMPNADKYLSLPSSIPLRTMRFSKTVAAGETSPYLIAERISDYMRINLRLVNSTDPPPEGADRADWLLFESGEGTQFDFVLTFLVMARANKVPCRMVAGFMSRPAGAGTSSIAADDFAVWAEIGLRDLGWVEYDPLRGDALGPASSYDYDPSEPRQADIPRDVDTAGKTLVPTKTNIDRQVPATAEVFKGDTIILVEGRIGDPSNYTLLPDMPVSVYLEAINGSYRCGTGYTNENGVFSVPCRIPNALPVGQHKLIAKTHGRQYSTTVVYAVSNSSSQLFDLVVKSNVTIALDVDTWIADNTTLMVRGVVEDMGHLPLAGKSVRIYWDGVQSFTATADDEGAFEGALQVKEHAGGYLLEAVSDALGHYSSAHESVVVSVVHATVMTISAPDSIGIGERLVFAGSIKDDEGLAPRKDDPLYNGVHFYIDGAYSATTLQTAVGTINYGLDIKEGFTAGKHTFAFYFPTSQWYLYSVVYINVTVMLDTYFALNPYTVVRGEESAISGLLYDMTGDGVGGSVVTLQVMNETVAIDGTDGDGEFSLGFTLGAEYPAGLLYATLSSSQVTGRYSNSTRLWLHLHSRANLTLDDASFVRRELGYFNGTAIDDAGAPLDGVNITISSGGAPLGHGFAVAGRFSILGRFANSFPVGVREVLISSAESGSCLPSEAVGFVTLYETSALEIVSVSESVRGQPFLVRGRLLDGSGAPAQGEDVAMTVGPLALSNATGAGGIFELSCTLPALARGNATLNVSFAGNASSFLLPAFNAGFVTLVRSVTTLLLTLPADAHPGEKAGATATLRDEAGDPLAGMMLTCLGANATTNLNGTAVFVVPIPANATGNVSITVEFPGTPTLLSSSAEGVVRVVALPDEERSYWWLLALGAVVLAGSGGGAYYLIMRRRRRAVMADVFEAAVREIEAGNRSAALIFDLYRRLEKATAELKLRRTPAQTAREFGRRVIDRLGVSPPALTSLLGIFEEARYSAHTIDEDYAARAKEAFKSVADELRGREVPK